MRHRIHCLLLLPDARRRGRFRYGNPPSDDGGRSAGEACLPEERTSKSPEGTHLEGIAQGERQVHCRPLVEGFRVREVAAVVAVALRCVARLESAVRRGRGIGRGTAATIQNKGREKSGRQQRQPSVFLVRLGASKLCRSPSLLTAHTRTTGGTRNLRGAEAGFQVERKGVRADVIFRRSAPSKV